MNVTDDTTILNFTYINSIPEFIDDNTTVNCSYINTILSFTDVSTIPNFMLSVYDSSWTYWAVVLDFFGMLAEDMY
jgi:hypothetical protein